MSTFPAAQMHELERLRRGALGVGVVCLLACVIGIPFSPAQFFRAYLAAYLFYLGLPLGCLATLMIYHLTGGAWGFLIRRILEAGMRTLPLVAVLFTPLAFGLPFLYPWARPEVVAGNQLLQHQRIYLNEPFFWARAAIYFVVWLVLGFFFSSWSQREDQAEEGGSNERFELLSGPGLVGYGITIMFASVDWAMSLQPAYRSTIIGPVFAAGQMLSGMTLALIVLAWLVARPPLVEAVSLEALNDLGNLLLTLVVIWSYLVFFQFMLTWIADLPYDVSWYVPRSQNGWQWVAGALCLFHFALPFFLLLLRDVKRNPKALAAVAGLILFMQLVYVDFQVLPAFPDTSLSDHWMDFLMPAGLGGIWLACFLWLLPQRPVLPSHDPNRATAAHFHELNRQEAAPKEEVRHG